MKRLTLSSSSLIGDKIANLDGEELGHVKELMIDITTGEVAYVVVSFGGFMGIGDKLFAIPFVKFGIDENNKCFVLNISKEVLKEAPGFDKNHWPDFSSDEFKEQIYAYYQVEI